MGEVSSSSVAFAAAGDSVQIIARIVAAPTAEYDRVRFKAPPLWLLCAPSVPRFPKRIGGPKEQRGERPSFTSDRVGIHLRISAEDRDVGEEGERLMRVDAASGALREGGESHTHPSRRRRAAREYLIEVCHGVSSRKPSWAS